MLQAKLSPELTSKLVSLSGRIVSYSVSLLVNDLVYSDVYLHQWFSTFLLSGAKSRHTTLLESRTNKLFTQII